MKPAPRIDWGTIDVDSLLVGGATPPAKIEYLLLADYLVTAAAFTPYPQPALCFDATASLPASEAKEFIAVFPAGIKAAKAWVTRNGLDSGTDQSDSFVAGTGTPTATKGLQKYLTMEDANYESVIVETGDSPSNYASGKDKLIPITEDLKPVELEVTCYYLQGLGLFVPYDQQTTNLETL